MSLSSVSSDDEARSKQEYTREEKRRIRLGNTRAAKTLLCS